MVVFAIPFRAKETTKDWNNCLKRLRNTIDSIYNQTDGDFRVIIACNNEIDFFKEYDNRLEFIKTDIKIPVEWIEMARDKFYKLTVIGYRIREILLQQDNPKDGIFVMPVDADDLLHCDIVKYVNNHSDSHGFISKDGYVWYGNKHFLKIYPDLHTFCGSCNIIKMYEEDLPNELPKPELCHDKETAGILNSRYPLRFDHNIVYDLYKKKGKEFSILPFRSTIYVRDTGENISQMNSVKEKDRFHPIAFLRSLNIFSMKMFTSKLKKQYAIKE